MRSWLRMNRWAFWVFPLAAVVFVASVWFITMRPVVEDLFGARHVYSAGESFEVGDVAVSDVTATNAPDPDGELTAARAIRVTVSATETQSQAARCDLYLIERSSPERVFRPATMAQFSAATSSSLCPSLDPRSPVEVYFVVPDGGTDQYALLILTGDARAEVNLTL